MQRTILIVDDEKEILDILGIHFEEHNFNVVKVNDSDKALSVYEETRPKLALLDATMPAPNGFQLCKKIKEISGKDVRVIIHTSNVDAIDNRRAREVGADAFTVKTGNFNDILTIVEERLQSI